MKIAHSDLGAFTNGLTVLTVLIILRSGKKFSRTGSTWLPNDYLPVLLYRPHSTPMAFLHASVFDFILVTILVYIFRSTQLRVVSG